MRGYLDYEHNWTITNHPTAKATSPDQPPAGSFVRLLREFANEEEQIGYFEFGFDATGVQKIIPYGKTAPVDPRLYVRWLNPESLRLLLRESNFPAHGAGFRQRDGLAFILRPQ